MTTVRQSNFPFSTQPALSETRVLHVNDNGMPSRRPTNGASCLIKTNKYAPVNKPEHRATRCSFMRFACRDLAQGTIKFWCSLNVIKIFERTDRLIITEQTSDYTRCAIRLLFSPALEFACERASAAERRVNDFPRKNRTAANNTCQINNQL